MRIAVDVDGVLADRIGSIVERINDEHGLALTAADVDRYDFTVPAVDIDIHEVIADSTWDRAHLRNLDPIEGAVEGMCRLATDHELLIATHRPERIHDETRRWLDAHDVPYDEFVRSCGPAKTAVEAAVLVDDRPANVRAFVDAGNHGILFAQPWNRRASLDGSAFVADSWTDVVRRCERASTE